MPSYVMHLCLAEEYAKKHEVKNKEQFIDGTLYPDGITPKSISHYSKNGSEDSDLYEFLVDRKLDSDYNLGYFLHLLADAIYYKKYFPEHLDFTYDQHLKDYDILSSKLIDYYNISEMPEIVKKYVVTKDEEPVIYNFDKVIKFIEDISNYDLIAISEKILTEKDFKFLLK